MSIQPGRFRPTRSRGVANRIACILVLAAAIPACDRPPATQSTAPPAAPAPAVPSTKLLVEQLADARIDSAKLKLGLKHFDEALALAISAWRADPASTEARALVGSLLAETVWNLPALQLDHGLPIEQLAFAAPSSLWVGLGGTGNPVVLWNLETLKVENVLFPSVEGPIRSMVLGAQGRSLVVERGSATLLCDARTLKPIRDIGTIPDFVTPSSAEVFSPEGLLFAHPTFALNDDKSIVWNLRDASSGELIRASEPFPAGSPPPLAAFLDREKLRVIHADGSLFEMPVSPVEPVKTTPMPDPATFLNAQFSSDGQAVLTLHSQGPHEPPVQSIVAYAEGDDHSLDSTAMMERFPWNRHPNVWNGLMNSPEDRPFTIDATRLQMETGQHAPVITRSNMSAVAFHGSEVMTGEESGEVTVRHLLPLPVKLEGGPAAAEVDAEKVAVVAALCDALSGLHYDEENRTFISLSTDQRFENLAQVNVETMSAVFPDRNFSTMIAGFQSHRLRLADAAALLPLWDRLARMDSTGKTWPEVLELSKGMGDHPWRQELEIAARARGGLPAVDSVKCRWLDPERISAAFDTENPEVILATIQGTGGKGPAAAAALALALKSDHPEWIASCVAQAVDLPPVLRQIATSRIAWIEGRKADGLSPWPENFPGMQEIRRREDWDGWELADFGPALDDIRNSLQQELAAVEIPKDSTAEQRLEVIKRLEAPETVTTIGKPRFALACMKAAIELAEIKQESEAAVKLAVTARNLGAPEERCMRAEATALTNLGKYDEARALWIVLLTEHPVEKQLPGDYAEAAYTAFENADPEQAMIILTTGMHRYPQDANFALRAGWVALLTGNAERAFDFLKAGKRVGYPEAKRENATALLVIAAAQCGAYDDATVYFNDLIAIDEAWVDPTTLDTLDWPEELKLILRPFMH